MNRDSVGRVGTEIDTGIWIWQKTPAAKRLVVFVHGIFGNPESTWQDFTKIVMEQPPIKDVDWANWHYTSRLLDDRKVARVAETLVTFLSAQTLNYEELYFICHSMGGLVVREACAQLCLSGEGRKINIYQRIKLAVLLAVPGASSRFARYLALIPFISYFNNRLPELADPSTLNDNFRRAFDFAKNNGYSRPRFTWFDGEDDQLVKNQRGTSYTADDRHGGVVPGNHSNAKSKKGAQSTVVKVVVDELASTMTTSGMISEVHTATRQLPTLTPVSSAAHAIILVACSAHKSNSNETLYPKNTLMLQQLAIEEATASLFRARVRVLNLIKQGKLLGVEFAEGNRLSRKQNRDLVHGPDLGGNEDGPKYLPAFRRYIGRCYQADASLWERFYAGPDALHVDLWIVSGLYGLVPAFDPIQNYDCHLSDAIEGEGATLADYWRPHLTAALNQRIRTLQSITNGRIRIIDLLNEVAYRDAISWNKLTGSVEVLHSMFKNKSGRATLDNIGEFLAALIANPKTVFDLKPDQFWSHHKFADEDQIAFESLIGAMGSQIAR
jgi:pimeloyl-ACP methyl ester carboxylesterase